MINITKSQKIYLCIWILLQPIIFFLIIASPERGGIFLLLPDVVVNLHDILIPFVTRASAY